MNGFSISLSHEEILALYRLLHENVEEDGTLWTTYDRIQRYLFQTLTLDQMEKLLEKSN